jgi:hypothetical protein
VEPTRSENGQIKTYKVKSKEAEVEIQLIDQLCENPNSRERFPYTVSISVKRINDKTPTIFLGCGLYVPDNRLHGRWTIESIKSGCYTGLCLYGKTTLSRTGRGW